MGTGDDVVGGVGKDQSPQPFGYSSAPQSGIGRTVCGIAGSVGERPDDQPGAGGPRWHEDPGPSGGGFVPAGKDDPAATATSQGSGRAVRLRPAGRALERSQTGGAGASGARNGGAADDSTGGSECFATSRFQRRRKDRNTGERA